MSQEGKFSLAELLNTANRGYQDGYLSEYYDAATGERRLGEGDTLAEFIVQEFRDTFDPHTTREAQMEEAKRVLRMAIADLEKVIEAIELETPAILSMPPRPRPGLQFSYSNRTRSFRGNWSGTSRSNYFRVKDTALFRQWTEQRGLGIFEKFEEKDDAPVFGIHGGDSTGDGSWPSYDHAADLEIDLLSELSRHLAAGQVAVLMEAGAEKLRYITGSAIAVNHLGRVIDVSLSDIYRKAARSFGIPESEITQAEY